MSTAMVDWIEEALGEIGLDIDTAPADTVEAFRAAFVRIEKEHGDERRTEIPPEIPDEPSKARGPQSKVRKPPPRRRGRSPRYAPPGVKNRDAEISEKQLDLLLSLVGDYGSATVKLFAKNLGIRLVFRNGQTYEDALSKLNRGQASDLIGALLKAQKAGEITKL